MRRFRIVALVALLSACGTTVVPPASPSPTTSAAVSPPPARPTGPTASPVPTPQSTTLPAGQAPACRGRDLAAHTGAPGRFTVLDPCRPLRGTVVSASHDPNGELRIALRLDDAYEDGVLDLANFTKQRGLFTGTVVCVLPITADTSGCGADTVATAPPAVGAYVSLTGPLVRDNANGWNALAPVWEIAALPGSPPSPGAGVERAKEVWSQIRAAWPLVPPAIVRADESIGAGGVASAALYPDGLAHLLIQPGALPDPHVLWHEAGHVLHAAADRSRGAGSQFMTSIDPVGNAFWAARGFPGTWAEHLATGGWSTQGYEAFAEGFAGVNTGDDERTERYGVRLDRVAMRSFFASLTPTGPP